MQVQNAPIPRWIVVVRFVIMELLIVFILIEVVVAIVEVLSIGKSLIFSVAGDAVALVTDNSDATNNEGDDDENDSEDVGWMIMVMIVIVIVMDKRIDFG